ncbi:hypothetical protein LTR70_009269 [Exophiala xenobiotica]|uniref:VanZ-like domain-containing protein n=1 Tax=Lithohypha guttulata TaxID=1690604 RepID=A0ABR0JZJ9_9EURO|nr:hypothetical protein LTR24_009071 [Lithohypha guttulata]KAK5310734.1 hypothetical protein LTR70_009269 [Exophiala xenobiotica]
MRIRLPFAFAFLLILLLASSAGLLPHSALPQTPSAAAPYIPRQSDKALHFVTFFALTASFYFVFDTARRRVIHITLAVCTLLLGAGSEVAQGLLPNDREFDPWDVLANILGSLAALGLANAYHKRSVERRRRAKYSALTGEGIDEEDLELGEGSGVVESAAVGEQETGVVSIDGPNANASKTQTVEEELDNWDENQPDDWSDDENTNTTGNGTTAKMTPATSSIDSSEEPRKKIAVD